MFINQPAPAMTIKKGTKVAYFRNWDRRGTCAVSFATVASCGNKQMTLISDDGLMLKHFVYAHDYANVLPVDGLNVEAEAMRRAEQFRTEQLSWYESRIGHAAFHQEAIKREISLMHEPRVEIVAFR